MDNVISFASFAAHLTARQLAEAKAAKPADASTNDEAYLAWIKKVWPAAAKKEEARLQALEEQVRISTAAYNAATTRTATLDMLENLKREVLNSEEL